MKKCAVAIAVVLLLASAPARADEPSDWVKCDGYARPEGAATTVVRLVALISTAGLFGLPESSQYRPAARGQEGVDACTRALDTHAADNFWARRITMLQARARHNIEADHLDEALADLSAAGEIARAQAPGAWYDRSLGVSATLLEGAILVKRGDQGAAERLAAQAADARPYSATVQMLASLIFAVAPDVAAEERRILNRMVSLNPEFEEMRALVMSWGDDRAEIADDMERALVRERAAGGATGEPVGTLARTALAAFRAGRDERARELAAELRTALAAPFAPPPATFPGDAQGQTSIVRRLAEQRADAQRLMPLVEAYRLAREGNRTAALALLASGPIMIDPATFALLSEVAADPAFARSRASLQEEIARMQAEEHGRRMNAIDITRFAEALPPLEQIVGGNRFRRQGWGADGYRDSALPDGSGRRISFSGGSTITTTEELALLRAAQLAQENGATGFVVGSRSDFRRYYVMTYAGVETSRSPSGFRTEMDVTFVDAANPPAEYSGRVLTADEVWNALSPVFNPPRRR